jgi:hypothetical protein
MRETIRFDLSLPGIGEGECIMERNFADALPGFEELREGLAREHSQTNQELQSLIDTLAVWNVDTFQDILNVRTERPRGLEVHTVTTFRLKPGSPALDQIGAQFAGKPLMIFEEQLLNFKLDEVDANIFLTPPEYQQVDLLDLLQEQDIRRNGLTPQ